MKNNKITMKRIFSAVMAGMIVMTAGAAVTVSAEETCNADRIDESVTLEDPDAAFLNNLLKQMKENKVSEKEMQLNQMRQRQKTVKIYNYGGYHAKTVKLYGRRIVKIRDDGSYELGGWDVLYNAPMHGLQGNTSLNVTGDYVAFAFTFDVTWGTDFPYSDVFWREKDGTSWNDMYIYMGGGVRSASIQIKVGDKIAVDKSNCNSHYEWKTYMD